MGMYNDSTTLVVTPGQALPEQSLSLGSGSVDIQGLVIVNNSDVSVDVFPGQQSPGGSPAFSVAAHTDRILPVGNKLCFVACSGVPAVGGTVYVYWTDETLASTSALEVLINNASIVVSGDVNANITNASLDVTGSVNANITNASLDVTGSVNANITNASLDITGTVNANVSGSVDITTGSVDINNTPIVIDKLTDTDSHCFPVLWEELLIPNGFSAGQFQAVDTFEVGTYTVPGYPSTVTLVKGIWLVAFVVANSSDTGDIFAIATQRSDGAHLANKWIWQGPTNQMTFPVPMLLYDASAEVAGTFIDVGISCVHGTLTADQTINACLALLIA